LVDRCGVADWLTALPMSMSQAVKANNTTQHKH
jgi:hypothetical protein